jgi:endo-1,4-beta-xylanase
METGRLTRRAVLASAAASLVSGEVAAEVARRALIPYGAAVMISDFRADAALRANLLRHCDLIVPMNELKWDWVRQTREGFRFENADEIIGFARSNGKSTHGHTLLWGSALPGWVSQLSTGREAERVLVQHIETTLTKYAGVVPSWDVVNEVIAHEASPSNLWRDMVWHRLLGPRLVDIAFAAAARTDPKARLALNDYDFENPDARTAERRRQALAIVRHLQDKKIPIHEIGMQAHLYGEKPIDRRAITAFCRELGRLGVAVRVTELDIIDWKLPGPAAERDRKVAALTKDYLEAVIEGQRPEAIITWGLSDRSTWVNDTFPRTDGLSARPLPLDAAFQPKPMMAAIQAARRLP